MVVCIFGTSSFTAEGKGEMEPDMFSLFGLNVTLNCLIIKVWLFLILLLLEALMRSHVSF